MMGQMGLGLRRCLLEQQCLHPGRAPLDLQTGCSNVTFILISFMAVSMLEKNNISKLSLKFSVFSDFRPDETTFVPLSLLKTRSLDHAIIRSQVT